MVRGLPEGYLVATPVYEGPLDLLLSLIEQAELDITRIALAQVTDQFLNYIHQLQERSPEEVSAFLVIAAKLLQIKSEALLPRPPSHPEGEEDPGEALARQLRVYKRFKEISVWLDERQELGYRNYLRLAPPPKIEPVLNMDGITLQDLVEAAAEVYTRQEPIPSVGRIITPRKITIRDRISRIIQEIRLYGQTKFSSIMGKSTSRVELVVTFLAVLELVKRRHVIALQNQLFSEIELLPNEDIEDGVEFELEFDDFQR
jgi:segregation and condensation protein A